MWKHEISDTLIDTNLSGVRRVDGAMRGKQLLPPRATPRPAKSLPEAHMAR